MYHTADQWRRDMKSVELMIWAIVIILLHL